MKRAITAIFLFTLLPVCLVMADDEGMVRVDDPNNSLVFGFIDMGEAPTKINGATIFQVAPPTDTPYWSFGVEDGVFYNMLMPQGTYKVITFYGSGTFKGNFEYSLGRQGPDTGIVVNEPGLHFMGSYRYVHVDRGGMFKQRKFSIEKVDSPSEAEVLRKLLEFTVRFKRSKTYKGPKKIEMEDTIFADRIRARIAELEQ